MKFCCLIAAICLISPQSLLSDTLVIDFETFTDSDILTNQIPGVSFTNTVVLTAGISVNEIDFPPHSGINVVSDNGGPIGITFDTPINGFAAYFTYLEPLTLLAFDNFNVQIGSALSLFSNNTFTAGDLGSSPNELLQISSLGGISSVSITGDPAGGSFVMDDVTLTTLPEPGTLSLTLAGIGLAGLLLRRTNTGKW